MSVGGDPPRALETVTTCLLQVAIETLFLLTVQESLAAGHVTKTSLESEIRLTLKDRGFNTTTNNNNGDLYSALTTISTTCFTKGKYRIKMTNH